MNRRPAGNKYGAVPTYYRGVRYDSKAEAAHAEGLDARLASGEIRGWLRQVQFRLGPDEADPTLDLMYRADFLVHMADGSLVVEEVKGCWTPSFKFVVKLWSSLGPRGYNGLRLLVISGKKIHEFIGGSGGKIDGDEASGRVGDEVAEVVRAVEKSARPTRADRKAGGGKTDRGRPEGRQGRCRKSRKK